MSETPLNAEKVTLVGWATLVLRRLFCGHNGTEMWQESETLPNGVRRTVTTSHVCTRCGKDML